MGGKSSKDEIETEPSTRRRGMPSKTVRLSCWMTDLSERVRESPLNMLAIPGSHDSLTNEIGPTARPAPDLEKVLLGPYKAIPGSRYILSPFFRVWCKTQGTSSTGQMKEGIRYFDLRVAPRTEKTTIAIAIVHGLYSCDVEPHLKNINSFLDSRPQELVILDFQHFYAFTTEHHRMLIDMLKSTFTRKLCPKMGSVTISLKDLTDKNYQVLVIYREDDYSENDPLLWDRGSWPSAWPNTMKLERMIEYAESRLTYRSKKSGFISQFILTPDADTIKHNPIAGVKGACAEKVLPVVEKWLADKGREFSPCVIIGDYVKMQKSSFCKNIIALNFGAEENIKFVK